MLEKITSLLDPCTDRNSTSSKSLRLVIKLLVQQIGFTPPFVAFTLAFINYFLTLDPTETWLRVRNAFVTALIVNWKVWTPAQAVNFGLVPLDYRVLFGNIVALWWNIYLSVIS